MLALPATKVQGPGLLAIVLEGFEGCFLRSRPADIDLLAVSGCEEDAKLLRS